jgi:nucleoside-diphosphate-sugar epimerase
MSFYSGKNVLVTGAAGITGQAAVKRLLDEGAFVRASVYKNKKFERFLYFFIFHHNPRLIFNLPNKF